MEKRHQNFPPHSRLTLVLHVQPFICRYTMFFVLYPLGVLVSVCVCVCVCVITPSSSSRAGGDDAILLSAARDQGQAAVECAAAKLR